MDDCIRGCRRVNGINREARFREVRWLRASTPWKMFGTAVRIISNFQPEWIGWFCSNNFRGNNFVPIISLSARCDGDQFPKQLIVFRYDNRSRSDTVQRFIADVFHFNLECPSECESNRTGEPILPRFEERKTAIQHCRASEISLPPPPLPFPPSFRFSRILLSIFFGTGVFLFFTKLILSVRSSKEEKIETTRCLGEDGEEATRGWLLTRNGINSKSLSILKARIIRLRKIVYRNWRCNGDKSLHPPRTRSLPLLIWIWICSIEFQRWDHNYPRDLYIRFQSFTILLPRDEFKLFLRCPINNPLQSYSMEEEGPLNK